MNFIKLMLLIYNYRKKIFLLLLFTNISCIFINKIYILYYQKQLKIYKKNHHKLEKVKRKLYTLANYKSVMDHKNKQNN
jgi:hypothetical protein